VKQRHSLRTVAVAYISFHFSIHFPHLVFFVFLFHNFLPVLRERKSSSYALFIRLRQLDADSAAGFADHFDFHRVFRPALRDAEPLTQKQRQN
jgi:hypothetical protein